MSITFLTIIVVLSAIAGYYYIKTQQLIKKEQELFIKRQSLLATLVHDLKTPTNAQINTLNMLKNEHFGKLNTQQAEMISLTQESCKYMSNLIGTIMDSCSYDTENINLTKELFDIYNLVCEICDQVKTLAQNNKIHIEIKNLSQNVLIYADKLQIERVITNLVSNSIKYSLHNTTVTIYLQNKTNYFEFKIKNMSKYIPESKLKSIFEKYKRIDITQGNKIGTGLGLYLSKKIIESHKGKMNAKSFNDGTCMFCFTLPLNADSQAPQLNFNQLPLENPS